MSRRRFCIPLGPLAGLLIAGCSGSPAGPPSHGSGVELRLTDAPTDTVTEIVVAIDHVEAHVGGGGFQTIGNLKASIDLLKLQNGWFTSLGVTALPSGKLTQLRLYVDPTGTNYVTTPDGVHHPLTVPSGEESGIKLKGELDIPDCATGSITLDFDGKQSIFTHPKGSGAGDEWLLRPVIRMKSVDLTAGDCNPEPDPTPSDLSQTPPPVGNPTPQPPPPDTCTCESASMYCYNGSCQPLVL